MLVVSPRWQKMLNDIWYNRTRILLAVASIAVGVFAVGTIGGALISFQQNTDAQFVQAQPPSSQIFFATYDEGLLDYVRKLPQVAEADGVRRFSLRLFTPAGTNGNDGDVWQTVQVVAIDDFDDIHLNKVRPEQGAWPPPRNTVVIERSGLDFTHAEVGDVVVVETTSGTRREMPVSGVVFAPTRFPSKISGSITAFVDFETLAWLEQPQAFNTLDLLVAGDYLDREHVTRQTEAIKDEIEQAGWYPLSIDVPQHPTRPPLEAIIQSVVLLLNVIGVALTGISGLLVTNTMDALLTQQIKQIGIMRTVGGQVHQVMALYFGFVVFLAILALVIAVPPSILAAYHLAVFAGSLLNVDILNFSMPWYVFALQVGLALLVALAAAMKPIITNTLHTTVRQAVQPFGINTEKQGLTERVLERVRGLSRPVALSLRNMFRQKVRLVLTLITLVLAGGVFIGVFSVQKSLQGNIARTTEAFLRYDIQVRLAETARFEDVAPLLASVPGVAWVEGWNAATVKRPYGHGLESDPMTLEAVPSNSDLVRPEILAGRWLTPDDENAVVVNTYVLTEEPDLALGDDITLTIDGRDTRWTIVGVFRDTAYISYPGRLFSSMAYFERATRTVGQVRSLQVVLSDDAPDQETMMAAIDEVLRTNGIAVNETRTANEDTTRNAELLNILVYILLIMALMLAAVGGISLTGTMGINVIERTREIGVMRAVGASSGDLLLITVVEALLIGFLSWGVGVFLGWPFGLLLSNALGTAIFGVNLVYEYSLLGVVAWLVLSLVISTFASIMPARSAMSITVRDAISYE